MSIPFPSFEALLASYFQDLPVRNWTETTIDRRQHSVGRFIKWLRAHTHITLTRLREVHEATHPAKPAVKPTTKPDVKPTSKSDT